MEHVIKSRLDTDLYIFTMWNAFEKLGIGDTQVEYTFVNRSGVDLLRLKDMIEADISKLCSLHFDLNDIDYLDRLHFINKGDMDALFDDMNVRKLMENL